MPASAKPKCPGCAGRHAIHRGPCPARAASRCQPFDVGGSAGFACGWRPPCPCAWRTCACGAAVAIAVELPADARTAPPGAVVLVPFLRGCQPPEELGARLAVRVLTDGWLACRSLADGEEPGPGEYRRAEHDDERAGHRITYTRRAA
jgi:hypothetical protein